MEYRIKEIEGYPKYFVDTDGYVWSTKSGTIKKLSGGINGNGYHTVGMYTDGIDATKKVHQLVAIAFMGHVPNNYTSIVDHIDGCRTNNKLSNLQIISQRENLSKDKIRSLPTGVYRIKDKTYSQIRIGNKKVHLGTFKTPEEAGERYQLALINIHLFNGNNKEFREQLEKIKISQINKIS